MFKGIPVSPGISIGTVRILRRSQGSFTPRLLKDEQEVREEMAKLEEALAKTQEALEELVAYTRKAVGEEEAKIFEAHMLILSDPMFREKISAKMQEEQKNASWAVSEAAEEIAATFTALEDEYFRARAVDIHDIKERIISQLEGQVRQKEELSLGTIIIAPELTPSDTATFSPQIVSGIVTEKGGPTSHAAIVARALGIPAVTGIAGLLEQAWDGVRAIVDGTAGIVYLDPEPKLVEEFEAKKALALKRREKLKIRSQALTRDGRRIEIAANIRDAKEAEIAIEQGAEGVGLFRTEFLFMNRQEPPSEEEQFQAYRSVLEIFGAKPVVIRTLDVGGDKPLPYLEFNKEENPFLGLRGIRLSLKYYDLFKIQLRALLRASLYGNLKIMVPMVTGIQEIRELKVIMEEAKMEVKTYGRFEIGVMIETPAAALVAERLAQEVDFFSLGTNDLTQYTLAVDRGNESVMELYDTYHPAVLRLIYQTATAAHQYGKWVGLCGELGGEVTAAPLLVALGLDEISMSAIFIPEMKEAIGNLSYVEAQKLIPAILNAENGKEVRAILTRYGLG